MTQSFDKLPCFVLETTGIGEILYINSYAKQHLNANVVLDRIDTILTKGSSIFFETYLLPCFRNETVKSEVFLTLRGQEARIPILFNITRTTAPKDHLLFIGLPIEGRIEKEKQLIEDKKRLEIENSQNKKYLDLQEDLNRNQLHLENRMRELSRINEEQKQLIKVLSHDLQEPVRKISVFSNLILNNQGKKTKFYLDRIHQLSGVSRNLLHDIQKYLLLEETFDATKLVDIDLSHLVETIKNEHIQQSFILKIKNEEGLVIRGDFNQFTLLFTELIRNSIQYSEDLDAPTIEITLDTIEKNVFEISKDLYNYKKFLRVNYRDNSKGFEKKYRLKVFQLFQKLESTEGLGLGLSYCKKVAELHQGTIEFVYPSSQPQYLSIVLPYK